MPERRRHWFVVWLYQLTAVMCTQFVLQMPSEEQILRLSPTWNVLGPFAAGMRELPFGAFPGSVDANFADLLAKDSSNLRLSTYGTVNGTVTTKEVKADVQIDTPDRSRQLLRIEYPEVDWTTIRQTAGWTALQWQMIAVADLEIIADNTSLAVTLDKTADFALVPATDFISGLKPIEWHTGDWYSYISTLASKGMQHDTSLPSSHHLLHPLRASYKLLIRSMFEVRIFGEPPNGNPVMSLGIDLASKCKASRLEQELDIYTDAFHSNVPHIVGGWIAGWGLSFGVRSTSSSRSILLTSVEVAPKYADVVTAQVERPFTLTPGQTLVIPVQLTQHEILGPGLQCIELVLTAHDAKKGKSSTVIKSVSINLEHKPAFWEDHGGANCHNAYLFSYLATDRTVQLAAATPPRHQSIKGRTNLPPVVLAHHGAGADIRDMIFSERVQRQNESWVIVPTGRSPWGYDWQLASFWAAQYAVISFHQHLYGLPPSHTMSNAERTQWNFDVSKIFVMGHSNGGQGAWYRLSRFPDLAIGGVVAAAYTKVADYVSFGWKVGRHFQDAMMDGLLHSSLTMFENDLFASNLAGIELLVKYGSADDNVPPWNSRDMATVVDAWNQRSNVSGAVRVHEIGNQPHWWDTVFTESDVQRALDVKCTALQNPEFAMPVVPRQFTHTIANPSEAGSKGGWKITELDVPGRLARLEVAFGDDGVFDVHTSNVIAASFQTSFLQRYGDASKHQHDVWVCINGHTVSTTLADRSELHFTKQLDGRWEVSEQPQSAPRPLGPLIRLVSTDGPLSIVVPNDTAMQSIARSFAADLLLYGGINSQIVQDGDFAAIASAELPQGNIVTLGGPHTNAFTAKLIDAWPSEAPFILLKDTPQFTIQGRSFYSNGTGLLALAPHPSNNAGLVLMLHGIGAKGVQRAARLLPTRTATMIPEWIVVDDTADWKGQGGVKATGWYNRHWGWSESMSYLD